MKNRTRDLGDTASLKRVHSLPSGASNIANLPSGASNIADLPSGASNIADLPSGANKIEHWPSGISKIEHSLGSKKCASLPSGSKKCATLPSGANNFQDLSSDFKNSSDIEKTSLSYINEEKQVCARKLIFGSFHQGDDRFSLFSRGSQCTCNALTMLVKCYEGFSCTSEFIDNTLISGDQLYVTVVKSLQEKGKF